MRDPKAKGERFLATEGDSLSLLQVSNILSKNFEGRLKKLPQKEMPNLLVKIVALFNPLLREQVPNLGIIRRASNEKARTVLNLTPRNNEEAIVATAKSLLDLQIVTK